MKVTPCDILKLSSYDVDNISTTYFLTDDWLLIILAFFNDEKRLLFKIGYVVIDSTYLNFKKPQKNFIISFI